jgi:hypothetical protein
MRGLRRGIRPSNRRRGAPADAYGVLALGTKGPTEARPVLEQVMQGAAAAMRDTSRARIAVARAAAVWLLATCAPEGATDLAPGSSPGGRHPCDTLRPEGQCIGHVAQWCVDGELRFEDCGRSGLACARSAGGQYYCEGRERPDGRGDWQDQGQPVVPSACGDVSTIGRCQGSIAQWCHGGQLQEIDCGALGDRCDYVEGTGYYCVDSSVLDAPAGEAPAGE